MFFFISIMFYSINFYVLILYYIGQTLKKKKKCNFFNEILIKIKTDRILYYNSKVCMKLQGK
jgi:hypothetical protein